MMGKTRKGSKGHSSGLVPDYRYVVETMAESEGFGSSGRIDMAMMASEDSYASKRKRISLNVDAYNWFGVPTQVLSLTKMTRFERRDLELRLKNELEQVRVLQKKITSFGSTVFLSSSSDIHSCSNVVTRPALGSSSQGKRWPTGRDGQRTKRTVSGRFKKVKKVVPTATSITTLMKQCETLLNKLLSHQYSWVFMEPVDPVKLNIPDYFDVIKHPMDLGTVKRKLLQGEYSSLLGFAEDVRLTFSNSIKYNPKGNDVHFMAQTLGKFFEVRWKPIEKKLANATDASVPSISSSYAEPETPNKMIASGKKEHATVDSNVTEEPVKRVLSELEKHKMSTELESLLEELPENIINFLKEQSYNTSQPGEDEIEIDIDDLSDEALFTLRKLLDDYLLDKQKKQGKAEPCEMELQNDSGFSNSSMQPCKGHDAIDEDVDIGGNDPLSSGYPPVEIEKDTALRNSKCCSSGASSSGSGSSSNDSELGSSSDNEHEGVGDSAPALKTKENIDSGSNLEQKMSDIGGPDDRNRALSGSYQEELSSEGIVIEAKNGHVEESAPPGRQVSPEKLYRAALLRSRFADTILKAKEKALEKGEKQDPEKLRLEREELERRRREEKARLQAEAEAAEEAKRKAEAEAAAEAKRKRELEREAARQALLKMEKTVDINENCGFMEDLEMLRAASGEDIQNFVDEVSPDRSENGLGSFKFQGNSNPLEQLGLYMKVDDEEEEESEPKCVLDATNDAEGER